MELALNLRLGGLRQGGGDIPFNPTQIPGLQCWYDASAPSTLVLDVGDGVIEWRDRSGNGFHISQADLLKRPSYNGSNEVEFNGVDEHLFTTAFTGMLGLNSMTTFVLGWSEYPKDGSVAESKSFWEIDSDCALRIQEVSPSLLTGRWFSDGSEHGGSVLDDLQSYVWRRDFDGIPKENAFWVDGIKTIAPPPEGDRPIDQTDLFVGSGADSLVSDRPQEGPTRQLMIYNRALSDAEVGQLLAFLDTKR